MIVIYSIEKKRACKLNSWELGLSHTKCVCGAGGGGGAAHILIGKQMLPFVTHNIGEYEIIMKM